MTFVDYEFHAVVINFAILHFALPAQALREVFRVLRAGGRIAFITRAMEEIPLQILQRVLQEYGDANVPRPAGPARGRFADPEECRRVLLEIGFVKPQVVQVPYVLQFPLPDGLFDAFFEGMPRVGTLFRAQSTEVLSAIRHALLLAA